MNLQKLKIMTLLVAMITIVMPLNLWAIDVVANGGFEDWTGGTPDDWTTIESGITVTEEISIVHGGTKSANVDVVTGTQSNTDFRQIVDFISGIEYTISVWVYHTEGTVKARIYAEDNVNDNYHTYSDNTILNSWQEVIYIFTAPETGPKEIGLRFYDQTGFDGAEIVYVDDYTMTYSGDILEEPTNYPTNFSATPGVGTMTLIWTDATGTIVPSGYLIKASDVSLTAISVPVDGTPVADDPDLDDGSGALNVNFGQEHCTFGSLDENTTYYFKIFPYTNFGDDIDFKTDGTPPSDSGTTPPGSITLCTIEADINADCIPDMLDNIVTVDGIVTVTNQFGSYGPMYFEDNGCGFAAYANQGSSLDISQFSIGDRVQLTGKISHYNGLGQLVDVTAASVINSGNTVTPITITLADVGEATESSLVKIDNLTIVSTGNWSGSNNFSVDVTDGITTVDMRVDLDTGIGSQQPPPGTFHLTAVVSQFTLTGGCEGFQLMPRSINDLVIVDGVLNPSNFSATGVSETQINLTWALNANGNDVVIAWNTSNEFGTPAGVLNVGNTIDGGGTVLYKNNGTSYQHTGLAEGTFYYYRAWSVTSGNEYSLGENAAARTHGDYYAGIGCLTDNALKTALNAILVADHTTNYGNLDDRDNMTYADEDMNDPSKVLLIYNGEVVNKTATSLWNREHTWPNSHGIDESGPGDTDLHHLRACNIDVNSARATLDFDNGGEFTIDGCNYDIDSFEPQDEFKGDAARSIFYMDVRYEGTNTHINSINMDPYDLQIVDNTYESTASSSKIGVLSTLLEWHQSDPVDAWEARHNDRVMEMQGNRNPFVDHPEWVNAIWGDTTIEFVQETATGSEGTTYHINVAITSPSSTTATTGRVTFDAENSTAVSADIGNFNFQDFSFEPNVSTNVVIPITINSDGVDEGNETATFVIENVSGGDYAAPAMPCVFTLTIEDGVAEQTMLQFAQESDTTVEGTIYEIGVSITNHSSTMPTAGRVTFDSANSTASAADIDNFSYLDFTFLPNISTNVIIPLTITPDGSAEGPETATFIIENVIGGDNAVAGEPSVFTLTIQDPVLPDTEVSFASASGTVGEGAVTYNLTVSISEPSATTATTVEVALIDGNAADIDNYTTQTVSFPAGSTDGQPVTITITDDQIIECPETLVFELQNIAGGQNATIVDPDQFTLTLTDNDTPNGCVSDLIISEYIEGSSYNKAIEIFNGTGLAVDLSCYSLEKDSNGNGEFGSAYHFSAVLAAGDVFVVADSRANALIQAQTDATAGVTSFNGNDQVRLLKNGVEIDRIGISGGTDFAKDVTYVRKWNVTAPQSGEQDPRTNGEWNSYPIDTFGYIGAHSCTQPNTVVQFAGDAATITAGETATFEIEVMIIDPDATTATSVDVVLTSDNAADIGNYTTTTVTFAAGSSASQMVSITMPDDCTPGTTTNYTFELQNVQGGHNPEIGEPDQFVLTVDCPSLDTVVYFESQEATVNEADGSYNILVSIENPDDTNDTMVDVVLIDGDAADLNGYETVTVTFLAGSSADEAVPVTIHNDDLGEADETFTFGLQNVQGGLNATIGNPGTFELTIEDDDDSIPPTISNVNVTTTSNSATITFDTDENAECYIRYGETPGSDNYTGISTTTPLGMTHSLTITGLAADNDYYFTIYAEDPAGNIGHSTEQMFTTDPPSDQVDLVINEIMKNSVAVDDEFGEWIEIYNPNPIAVDLLYWEIQDADIEAHQITQSVNIPAFGYAVLCRNIDTGVNGNVPGDYQYSDFQLGNGSDEVILVDPEGRTIDVVNYTDADFPDDSGKSLALKHPGLDNSLGQNWLSSVTAWAGADLGTPGARNFPLGDVNFDGVAIIVDLNLLVDHILDGDEYDIVMDIDSDGSITIVDINQLVVLLLSAQ